MKKKVYLGLSGGVDSALSAALLKEQGFDVTGVFIETWHPDFIECTWKEDRREAMRAAAHLDIPFISLNLSKEYEEKVAHYFIEEYRKGRTPNPDVICNKQIKFGGFLDFALKNGADFIATGHYAQIKNTLNGKKLAKGVDGSKDQSYFLWMLTKEDLEHVIFPLGAMTKKQVRAQALKRNLPQAKRKDSQGICFLGTIDLPDFLGRFIPLQEGQVLSQNGDVIGTHKGASLYTIGERHGFSVVDPKYREEPLFVHSIDIQKNAITVGPRESTPKLESVTLSDSNIALEKNGEFLDAVLRYHSKPVRSKIEERAGKISVYFEAPQQVALGQSLVLYQGDTLVGGGVIESN